MSRNVTIVNKEQRYFCKFYRGYKCYDRAQQEVFALRLAEQKGILCPRILSVNLDVPYVKMTLLSNEMFGFFDQNILFFFHSAVNLLHQVHKLYVVDGVGYSWLSRSDDLSFRGWLSHLIKPMPKFTGDIEWLGLCTQYIPTSLSSVSLHGDPQIEHFVYSDGLLWLVDWETVSRAPAVFDFTLLWFSFYLHMRRNNLILQSSINDALVSILEMFLHPEEMGILNLLLLWHSIRWASFNNEIFQKWIHVFLEAIEWKEEAVFAMSPYRFSWKIWQHMASLPY